MTFFRSIGSFIRRFRFGTGIDPARDWFALISLSAIVLVGIVVWNVWVFDTVANGDSIGAPAVKVPAAFSQSSLEAIRTLFTNRAAEEAKYMTGVYRFADPSQ